MALTLTTLRGLYETPRAPRLILITYLHLACAAIEAARSRGPHAPRRARVEGDLGELRNSGRPTRVARDGSNEAMATARELGFPVAVKLWSRTITHKTDVGGVQVGGVDVIADGAAQASLARSSERHGEAWRVLDSLGVTGAALRRPPVLACELMAGELLPDPSVRPEFSSSAPAARWSRCFRDRALALPPLNTTLARRMMEQMRYLSCVRAGARGRPPVDVEALAGLLVRFGDLVVENPRICESTSTLLLASPEGLLALDARVVSTTARFATPIFPKTAIRPYPSEYVSQTTLRDGTPIVIRPIRPDDEPLVVAFHKTLSEDSVRMRYMQAMKLDERTAHQRLLRICFIDYDREIALVAEREPAGGNRDSSR